MLEDSHLIPNTSYGVHLHESGAFFALVEPSGKDFLLFVVRRDDSAQLAVNDRLEGVWGQELTLDMLPASAEDRGYFEFRFTGTALELTTPRGSIEFPRFDEERAGAVRFTRMQGASFSDRAPKLSIGSLDVATARIASHLLHRRIDALEAAKGGPDDT